jgi:hypothetical protein
MKNKKFAKHVKRMSNKEESKDFKRIEKFITEYRGNIFISIMDSEGNYNFDVCSQYDTDNECCGKYCNVDCAHWSHDRIFEKMSNKEYSKIKRMLK